MGFDTVTDDLVGLRHPIGSPSDPVKAIEPPQSEGTLGPAFRQGNWLVSMAAADHTEYKPEPKYSPLNEISDSRYMTDYSDEFVGSRSSAETKSIMARIDQREKDLDIIKSGGWYGTISGVAAGLVDPLNAAPGGAIYKGYKGGAALKTMLSVARATALTTTAQEALLSASHPERGVEESIFNIGTATIIGGLFGAGASKLVTSGERKAAMDAFDRIARPAASPGASIGAAVADARELVPEGMGMIGGGFQKVQDGIQTVAEQVAKVPVVGNPLAAAVRGVGAVIDAPGALVRNIGPTNRVAYNGATATKKAMFDLAESPGILFAENVDGMPTVSGGGAAVETEARVAIEGGKYRMRQEIDGAWKHYYWGNQKESFGKIKAMVAQATGRQEDGRLSLEQFREEVAKAMRRNDEHQIPQVADTAKELRKTIFEPWKKLAIDLKIFPEGVNVDETAMSYLMRLYNHEKIIGERPQVEAVVSKWLADTQDHNAGLRNALEANLETQKARLSSLRKLEGRIATAEAKVSTAENRLSERAMEAQATERRYDTVESYQADVQKTIDDLNQFAADLKESGNTHEILKQVKDLEQETADLAGGMKSITKKDLEVVDKAVRDGVLVGPMRRVARIVSGKAKLPKGAEPFWKYVARIGGVKDDGGDLMSMIGQVVTGKSGKVLGSRITDKSLKRLFRDGGMQWDDLQQKLADEFPDLVDWGNAGDGPAQDFSDDVRKAIADSYNGTEPDWYTRDRVSSDDDFISTMVAEIEDGQSSGLIPDFKTPNDFADFMAGENAGISESDYDKIIADMEAGSANMQSRVAAVDVQNMADVRRETVTIFKAGLEKAKRNRAQLKVKDKVSDGRVKEAGVAAGRNMRRVDVLDRQSSVAQTQHDLLSVARENLQKEIDDLRLQAETHLAKWKGKSSSEALSAIASRTEAERLRGLKKEAGIYGGKDARLTGADSAVEKAMRRIIASDRDKSPEELQSLASEIIDRILSTPDGRLSYDAPTGGPKVGAQKEGPPPRGPLAHRSFMIPDELIEPWLVNDVEQIATAYLGTMVPDTLIHQRFGDVDMESAFKNIRDEYTARRQGMTDPKQLKELQKQYDADVVDLAGVRDRLRGTYNANLGQGMRNVGRIAQSLSSVNVLLDMGGSAISQLNDLVTPIARYSFMGVFNDGYVPFIKGMMKKDGGAFAEAAEQFRAMGIGTEMQLDTKAIAEVGEDFHPRTKGERTLKMATDYYMVANFSAPITAKAKNIAAIVASSEILKASKAVAEGTATKIQIRNLAENSITVDLAERIHAAFETGGVVKEGVMLPNTHDWVDMSARNAFEGAVSREANLGVLTPGQEKPFFLSHPVTKLLGQFKSFTGSATTRILLANLQRRDAAVLQGIVAQIAMGMVGYKIYSEVSGRETSDRPQDWVKEGVSRSGILGWMDEGNAFAAKFSGGKLDMYKAIGADKPLSRYASRSVGSQLMGPTWGKIENAAQMGYAVSNGEMSQSDLHAMRRLLPMQNLFYLRALLDEVEKSAGSMIGVK